jgi:protein PhnA
MRLENELKSRSLNSCELCKTTEKLKIYTLQPSRGINLSDSIYACIICISQIENSSLISPNHWRCINESMWSEFSAVKVISWRMLNRTISSGWSQGLLDMMYLSSDDLEWAKALGDGVEDDIKLIHRDVNGVILKSGDSVVLVKDLKVKGSSMTAKQGVAIRKISLDHENDNYIEGKICGQNIVIITKYVKKI